ncbi:hypothetical protein KQI52_03355 [bacterium]|nr:hypothetical protein [bacterium]
MAENEIIRRPLPEGARLRCFKIGGAGFQVVEETAEVAFHEEGAMHWVDIQGIHRDQLYDLLDVYGLHPLHREALSEVGQISRVFPANGALFLEFSALESWEKSNLRRISILHRKNFILTVHRFPIPGVEELITQLGEGHAEWTRNTDTLLYHLLDHLLDGTFQQLMNAREAVIELNDLFEEHPDELEDQDVHGTRRSINRLAISCEDQYYVISALQALDQDNIDLSFPKEFLRDLLAHAQYANRYANRLDDRAKELKFLLQTSLQERTEGRLRTMTIIMAIFTPLTFLAGIYGMNFAYIPELAWKYSYFVLLGVMGVTASVLLIIFWRRGWFD